MVLSSGYRQVSNSHSIYSFCFFSFLCTHLFMCFFGLLSPARPDLQSMIKDTIRGLRKNFRKMHKAQQSSRTLQSEVSLRRLPEGDNVVEQMGKLQQPVMERMEWARRFRSPFPPHISKEVYEEFMRLLFSSLYLFSPQGRISGSTAIPRSYFYCDVSIMSIPSLVFFRH